MSLSQKDLTYIATPDLRTRYHPGQTLNCVLKEYDRREGQFWVSVKDTVDNPFFGALRRHPIGSRRQAVISGKYGGGEMCIRDRPLGPGGSRRTTASRKRTAMWTAIPW